MKLDVRHPFYVAWTIRVAAKHAKQELQFHFTSEAPLYHGEQHCSAVESEGAWRGEAQLLPVSNFSRHGILYSYSVR